MLISYARHHFPPVVIQYAIWLYVRFTLSYRDVEELLAERGLEVSYETIRRWGPEVRASHCAAPAATSPAADGALASRRDGGAASRGSTSISGARWTAKARSWTSSSSTGGTRRRPASSCASCS